MATSLEDAFIALAKRKSAHNASAPLLGLGVTIPCPITKRPANLADTDNTDLPISNEIAAKRSDSVLKRARDRFILHSPAVTKPVRVSDNKTLGPFCMPKEFDDLGRTHGETSYIGVVHIDGNGMAKKISQLANGYRDPLQNYEYRKKMLGLSREIEAIGAKAIEKAVERLLDSLASKEEGGDCFFARAVKVEKAKDEEGYNLPIRFLVYGGDDITFVCDGRLALDLAAFMLESFQEQENGYHACAGVAIVKSHYPFSRAYKMAEELCRNAKQFVKVNGNSKDASAIDWHITAGGIQPHIGRLRKKEYVTPGGESLTFRPYIIPKNGLEIPTGHDWQWFRNEILDHVINPNGSWASHKSKLRELASFIREGKEVTSEKLKTLHVKGLQLPPVGTDWSKQGFYWQGTPYLDAIELLDMAPHSPYWTKQPCQSSKP